ncbi:hypothetical protein [Actinokineospora cianjurensis]|uniref:Uncharacterized protein n=1 Tax=Actinokineospora cianjurensis TaxID=585224 RepID=A0A421AXB6_9PSEU|nr:hypothetical protein [Actinokineospora cianjurensis]RLK54492.1 hypothetical protein CLV68_5524 [Actinokineospora cianjurensis]
MTAMEVVVGLLAGAVCRTYCRAWFSSATVIILRDVDVAADALARALPGGPVMMAKVVVLGLFAGALRRTYHRAWFSSAAVITPRDIDTAADALARIEHSLVDR